MLEKLIIRLILVSFFLTSIGPLPDASAQTFLGLPAPGAMVDFSPKFNQASLKGIIFHPQNPFKFDFILDEGDAELNEQQAKAQTQKIASYFLASLTTPENQIWVNLSPYEKGRIIPANFGNTLMGQNLLAQDYMLKQIMATALYPERQLGREFWKKVYTQALMRFGTTNIPIDTFNKVWIVPAKAVVYENTKINAVFVAESTLKVMLEKDYLAAQKHIAINAAPVLNSVSSTMSSAVIKELVIPALEKEVNEGKNFAPLRQVYNALILAKWYKDNLKNNVIARGYVDRNKIAGVESHDKQLVSEIYHQYLKAYKKGVFNYIKEDFDDVSQSVVPRKYFSGGFMGKVNYAMTTNMAMVANSFKSGSRRFFLASLVVGPALAQEARRAIGVPTPAIPVPLNPTEEAGLIKDIENARKNPKAASAALRQMSYRFNPKAVKFAASILKERPDPLSLDKALKDLPSNSSGPALNFPGGPSVPVGITNLGVVELALSIGETVRQRLNIGDSTLRYEAALYLESVAGHANASSNWDRFFQKGAWEALNTEGEKDATVKAARLVAQAAFIKAGKESRKNIAGIGNDNIAHLDQVFKELQSDDPMVRWSALMVFDSIKKEDKDNQYQGMIGMSLQQQSKEQKGPADIVFFEKMAAVAQKHGMATVLPSVMKSAVNYFNRSPFEKTVGTKNIALELKNWHESMQNLIELSIKLSDVNGNNELSNRKLLEQFDELVNNFNSPGSTDTFNYLYLGLLFTLVKSHRLSIPAFESAINAERERNNLEPVHISENQINFEGRDPMASLEEINDRKDITKNVQDLVALGGPMYFQDLLELFQRTDNVATVQAILDALDTILSMGIYPRDNNPWVNAVKEKAKHDNITIRDAVKKYELNKEFGIGVLADLKGGDRLTVLKAFELLLTSNFVSEAYVPDTVRFVFSENNPILDNIETGQTKTFNQVLSSAARVIMASGMNETQVDHLIDLNTPATASGTLTARQLRRAIDAVRKSKDPQAELTGAMDEEWNLTERRVNEYMLGADLDPKRLALELEILNKIYKSPSAKESGYKIVDEVITKFVKNKRNPEKVKRLADVIVLLKNKAWAFDSLIDLLDLDAKVRYPDVDGKVLDLFLQREMREPYNSKKDKINPLKESADNFIEMYLYWFDQQDAGNSETGANLTFIGSKISAFGPEVLGKAVTRKIDITKDPILRAALEGLLKGKIYVPNESLLQRTAPSEGATLPGAHLAEPSSARAIAPSKGLPYYQALSILTDSNSSEDQVVRAINSLQTMSYPPTVFKDLLPVLRNPENYSWYSDPAHKRQFIKLMAEVVKQRGRTIRGGDTYSLIKKAFLDALEQADDFDTQLEVLNAFLSTSDQVTAELFWEGLNRLQTKYGVYGDPQIKNDVAFSGDTQKRTHFFDALRMMRKIIKNLETEKQTKYEAITGLMQSRIKSKIQNHRFNVGIEYIFLLSIDPLLVDPKSTGISLGIEADPDDHFRKGIERPSKIVSDEVGNRISSAYGILAGRLNSIIPQASSYKTQDTSPLAMLEGLFNTSNPIKQMWAIWSLKEVTLLFQNVIPLTTPDVRTFLFYQVNQSRVESDDPQMMMDESKALSKEDKILQRGQFYKRGERAKIQALHDLQNEELFNNDPQALYELVVQSQMHARSDMVGPLLNFYFERKLFSYNKLRGLLSFTLLGKKIEDALGTMKSRDANVANAISNFRHNLPYHPLHPQNWGNAGPVLDQISTDIGITPNKAMTTETNGGIDLEGVHVKSQGTGKVETAFDDPAQLAILMKSDGLIPVIERVKPLSQSAINQLLGTI